MKISDKPARPVWSTVFTALLMVGALGSVHAQTAGPGAVPDSVALSVEPPAKARETRSDYVWTLEDLGARRPFRLNGVDTSDRSYFDIRADEVVNRAQLTLGYTYSPSLITELSHINVLLNEVVAMTLPVPKASAGKFQEQRIDLPAPLVTEFNELEVQFIGHYTLECEDPLHSSLWANISNQSTLELSVDRLVLPNDLAILPRPFFDQRDRRRLELPFVFTRADAGTLESAGIMASWFGALASYRGASFPVSLNGNLPEKGNAIVFVSGNNPEIPGLAPTHLSGPAVKIVPNPKDQYGKLLVVMGRDHTELKRAAQALVLGQNALSGSTATITGVTELEPRKPYDAPNWLRTDRPVKFGELVPPQALEAVGYGAQPVRIPLRMPPDLFGWRSKAVPIDLRYTYSPQIGVVDSTLIFDVNEQFQRSFPLLSVAQLKTLGQKEVGVFNDVMPARARLQVPLERLMRRSELQYRYMYDYIKEGHCRDVIIDNVRGTIDPESTIDLRGYPHFMPMPDLAAFSETGFPFTRMADLSETAVVLGSSPAMEDISTYLTLLGRFGESTGYPATAVSVALGQGGLALADKDLVIIASGDQSWLSQYDERLPAVLQEARKRFTTSDLQYKSRDWITPDPREVNRPVRAEVAYSSDGANAIFAGFESGLQPGRSIVLIAAGDAASQMLAGQALLGGEGYEGRIQGSLVAVHGKQISPLVADQTYTVGYLDPWRRLEWTLVKYWPGMPPLRNVAIVLGLILGIALLLAISRWLRRRKPERAK